MKNKLGKRLKHYRKKMNLTLNSAVEELGFDLNHLIDIENGKTIVSGDEIIKFSNLYKISLENINEENRECSNIHQHMKCDRLMNESEWVRAIDIL